MSKFKDVYIVSAVRTPVGNFMASLSSVPATRLGAIAIEEAIKRANIEKNMVDEVIMGNVLMGGEGQAPARQATRFAGLPDEVCAMTINKVCGSGLKSVMLAAQAIMCEDANIVVAGGMESMSNAPFAIPKARNGLRMGNDVIEDLMIKDGLWDVYAQQHMGSFADKAAREKKISREEQDDFALESYKRSSTAWKNGEFDKEVVPVRIESKKGEILVKEDDEPKNDKLDKLRTLKPAFNKDGTVTAGNASTINDGAAALVVVGEDMVKKYNLKPIARVVAQASAATAPDWFTIAPVYAIEKVCKKANLKTEDIDYWEINEAFAVVTILAMKAFNLPSNKVNIRGGAVSIGHPIGASGSRVITTLLHIMKDKNFKYGLATACIGGGEASAIIFENV